MDAIRSLSTRPGWEESEATNQQQKKTMGTDKTQPEESSAVPHSSGANGSGAVCLELVFYPLSSHKQHPEHGCRARRQRLHCPGQGRILLGVGGCGEEAQSRGSKSSESTDNVFEKS